MKRTHVRHVLVCAGTIFVVLMAMAVLTAPAFAAVTWSSQTPAVGGTVGVTNPTISVKATDPAGIAWYSRGMKLDGVRKTPTYNASTGVMSVATSGLSYGTHTVYFSVNNNSGQAYSTTWTFTIAGKPTIGTLSPADGSTTNQDQPTISALVSPNNGVLSSWSMTVDGNPVSATWNAASGVLSYTPTSKLRNDAVHTVALDVTNSGGFSASVAWSFTVQIYADMTDTAGCTDCHPAYPESHPMTNCAACHGANSPVGGWWSTPDYAPHSPDRLGDCVGCHQSVYPTVPKHGDVNGQHQTISDMSGCACHVRSLTIEHNRWTDESGGALSCASCHGANATQRVKDALAAGSTNCLDCHDIPSGHPYGDVDHVADNGATSLAGTSFTCGDCHNTDLLTEHEKTSSSSNGGQCSTCHPNPRDSFSAWNDTCSQGGCHAPATSTAMHGNEVAAHTYLDPNVSCLASGCHGGPANLETLHSDAATTTPSGGRTSCLVCHADGIPATKACVDCHPDRVAAHGYPAEKHTASESCVLGCHTNIAGMTELKPLHDTAKGSAIACSACHATLVPDFANLYPAGWDKKCTACHAIKDLHPAAAASHTGVDTAYQANSFLGNGCSSIDGHTQMMGCHDISNVALVHSTMSANGCPVCHGEGKTPDEECFTCHKPGSATSYARPGEPSASIFATPYPNADNYMTPGWTYTTTPAGQPVWNVVNSVYPPANTTRYVTVTSNAAGGFLWGFAPQSIPDNARITDVRIYAKAKATNTTYPRKMQGVFKIGGQSYLGTPQSGNLSTIWTAGMGTSFGSTSTRIDYTREPLYGEMIWRNPKTGQDWTPAEINGTDPDSSLEAFGVNLTGSTAANNVSFAQIFVRITYYTVGPDVTHPTVGTHTYHIDNVKYLHDKSDVPAGQRFAVAPAHGWYDALCYQDCYDFCHRGEGGVPTFSANQGTWMWYSVGGDPYDTYTQVRTLALRPIKLPSSAPVLTFDTNYRLGSGAAGYVEISTDDGASWTALTGTVGGSSLSSLSGDATGWVNASYDLSAYAGQTAKLRFRYVNGSSTLEGWAFDSLAISGADGTVFSDNAETLKPDWTNSFWTRSMGAFPMR